MFMDVYHHAFYLVICDLPGLYSLRAYSMGGDAYTLCYDGRIVEISLPFTPTDEQMAIVDEKLGV